MNLATVTTIVRELLGTFFVEAALPLPRLKLVNRLTGRYLARCVWRKDESTTTIEVQRSVLGDEASLRRVLAHELIHHWQFLRTDQTTALALAKLGRGAQAFASRTYGHGADFQAHAARINAKLGADFVTAASDQTYDTSQVPAFYILIQPHGTSGDRYGFTVALRPSAQQRAEIAARVQTQHARLFRSIDGHLWTRAIAVKRFGGYALPREAASPCHQALAELYQHGTPVQIA